MVGPGEDGRRTSTPSPPRLESPSRSSPPCSAACWATIASPRPVPPGAAPSPRANGSSSRARWSGGMPGPSSSTRMIEPPVVALEPDADAAAARPAVQRGVVEQVVDQQPQAALPAVDRALVDAAGELVAHARVALARAVHRGVEQVAELDRLAREALGRLAARERLQALEQVDHAVLLGGHVGHERLALLERQLGVAGERVELGAQRGQRRAQLVAGVGGEAPRRLERALGGGALGAEPRRASRSARRRAGAPRPGRPARRPAASRGPRRRGCARRPPRSRASGRTASVVKPPGGERGQRQRDRAEQQDEPAGAADALLDRRERARRSAAAGCRSRRP